MRVLILLYGSVSYAIFLVAFLYAIVFVNDFPDVKTVSSGEGGPLTQAIIVNLLLLSLFAIQHTIMARPVFKAWFTKIVPTPAERPTFVLLASLILCLMYWQWRPMPEVIWQTHNTALANGLIGMSLFGFLIVLYATFLINHFDLFGLRQVWLYFKGVEYTPVEFKVNSLYKIVRNPLMTGFLIAFWFTPNLTQAHLLFAVVTTGYIFFGVFLEERDAAKALGKEYLEYRSKTPMLIPFLKFGGGSAEESTRNKSESK